VSGSGADRLGMSRRRGERWGEFAERVANAFGLVLLLLISTYVLGSLTPSHGWSGAFTILIAVTAGTVGLASAGARSEVVRGAGALALAAVACGFLSAILDSQALLGASGLITTVLLLVAALAILRTVVTETEVGFRTILGAISVYIILGLLFSFLYIAVDRIQGTPFFGSGTTVHDGDTLLFSFYTLTTTGYGNLVPAGQPGKLFAGLEMLLGNIFLVTLVAGLVSLWRPRRPRGTPAS
jgi:ion channel